MSMGPITIFDKSTLQSLNSDEAAWFENFYRANITPLFFVETLANLEKEIKGGRTPEQVVGNLAHKTPVLGAFPNVHHRKIILGDLMGQHIERLRVPVIEGGRPFTTGDRAGVLFEEPKEIDALARWGRGDFLGVERQFARTWRQALNAVDLRENTRRLGIEAIRLKCLKEVRTAADVVVQAKGRRYAGLIAALELLDVPQLYRSAIINRWKAAGKPPLPEFAPYAAYVFAVDVFFYLALGADLISPDRVSNRIDIAYLYYLPFCMVFVSNDRLHAKTAPLFLNDGQDFVHGKDLKSDLAKLDAHYSTFPADVRERGITTFAPRPPRDGDFLTACLWDRFLPGWRQRADEVEKGRDAVRDDAILEALRPMMKAARRPGPVGPVDVDTADNVIFERRVPVRRGKWRMVPPEAEATEND